MTSDQLFFLAAAQVSRKQKTAMQHSGLLHYNYKVFTHVHFIQCCSSADVYILYDIMKTINEQKSSISLLGLESHCIAKTKMKLGPTSKW